MTSAGSSGSGSGSDTDCATETVETVEVVVGGSVVTAEVNADSLLGRTSQV